MHDFAALAKKSLDQTGISMRKAAKDMHYDVSYVSRILNGHQAPSSQFIQEFSKMVRQNGGSPSTIPGSEATNGVANIDPGGEEEEEGAAWNILRGLSRSEVGREVIEELRESVEHLAISYPRTPPKALLKKVARQLEIASSLLDNGRVSLSDHRDLVSIIGWLSLLSATCSIDVEFWAAARLRLRTSMQAAKMSGDNELAGWCLETQAWAELTSGNHASAASLSRQAQEIAPPGGSVTIQATAQEGRAWARMGNQSETYKSLARVEALVEPLSSPENPEHHFRYDPAKADAYIATILSWIGDPAAEDQARSVLHRLESKGSNPPRPRRAASARLDLALALAGSGKPDEASRIALDAVNSGRLVPSNYWRVEEVLDKIAPKNLSETKELSEAYRELSSGNQ